MFRHPTAKFKPGHSKGNGSLCSTVPLKNSAAERSLEPQVNMKSSRTEPGGRGRGRERERERGGEGMMNETGDTNTV